MTGRLGRGHPVADQCEGGTQLLVIELWSAGVPSARAAATPSRVRSAISRRSNWAIAPKTWKTSSLASGRGSVDLLLRSVSLLPADSAPSLPAGDAKSSRHQRFGRRSGYSFGAATEAVENPPGKRAVIAVEMVTALGFDHRHLVLRC